MNRSNYSMLGTLAAGIALAFAACGEPTSPAADGTAAPLLTSASSTLIECPTSETLSAEGTIDLLGGTISVGGSSITVPEGAVLLPTVLTLTVPASKYMEVRVTANGQEHFQFEEPVSVTIGYSRCTRTNIDKAALTAFYIDGVTKALLENMGGTDDKSARTVTFGTKHFSSYALAE